jgi:glycerophosphoryl diester phosphodiesterase
MTKATNNLQRITTAGLLLAAWCSYSDADDLATSARRVTQIIAHRGASSERPECTLAAIRRAIEVGATAVEMDVRTSKDGVLFLLHDATLDRTTDGEGSAAARTISELKQLDAGSWFNPAYKTERIPTLREALSACRGQIDVVLDLKEQGAAYAKQVAAEVRECGEPSETIVGVRSVAQAQQIRMLLPQARQLGLIPNTDSIEAFADAGVETIRLWPRWLTTDGNGLVERVRKAQAKLHLNGTLGTAEEIRPLLAHGPNSLSSDDPRRLMQTLNDFAGVPRELQRWLVPQRWQRDTKGPIISLGEPGDFDDTHIFAPAVALEGDRFSLWYCGSRRSVAERVFQLGLATSVDGKRFSRHSSSPVFEFGDGRHSVLTPSLLRDPNGTVLREDGKLRMWFSSTWFEGGKGLHSLHETFSDDGIHWSEPSPALLENIYAPTIIKVGSSYQMWYTDVAQDPWIMRHAKSHDGRKWRVTADVALGLDQDWERQRLFYPTVVKIDEAYLMWYGSYWQQRRNTTALGFAVSADGIHWHKHPQNPVLRPDPDRPWEANYVTSQSVMQLADGSFRIWYASRKKPPFVNKYFALNTARWVNPPSLAADSSKK